MSTAEIIGVVGVTVLAFACTPIVLMLYRFLESARRLCGVMADWLEADFEEEAPCDRTD